MMIKYTINSIQLYPFQSYLSIELIIIIILILIINIPIVSDQ